MNFGETRKSKGGVAGGVELAVGGADFHSRGLRTVSFPFSPYRLWPELQSNGAARNPILCSGSETGVSLDSWFNKKKAPDGTDIIRHEAEQTPER